MIIDLGSVSETTQANYPGPGFDTEHPYDL
jgi:hypothetical protein